MLTKAETLVSYNHWTHARTYSQQPARRPCLPKSTPMTSNVWHWPKTREYFTLNTPLTLRSKQGAWEWEKPTPWGRTPARLSPSLGGGLASFSLPRLPVLFPQQAENDVTSGPSPQDILRQAHTWPLSPCFRRLLHWGFLIASWPPRPDSPVSLTLPPCASCHHVTAYLRLMITSERVGALASAVLGCVFSAWKDRLAPNRRSANTCWVEPNCPRSQSQ